MTMYETENEITDSIPPEVDVECYFSCIQRTSIPSTNKEARTRSLGYSGNDRCVTINYADRLHPVHNFEAPQTNMSNGFAQELDSGVNNLCEQLGSVEMFDDEEERTNFAYEHDMQRRSLQPHFENVYAQDRDGDSMLHMAIIALRVDLALLFISISPSNALLNLRNHLYQTALHLAVLTKQTAVVRRLIVGGADVESRDRDGNTPLHIACRDEFIDGVRILLEPVRYIETKQNKYDIPYQRIPQNLEIPNYNGLTCLHLAASSGHMNIVKLLIDKRADVNSRDLKNGRSILHKACSDGDLELVKLLLKCQGCDINVRTYDDLTPFDFARDRSHDHITFELAVAGARYTSDGCEYE